MLNKKIIISAITIILALVVVGTLLYSFNEAKKLAESQAVYNQQLADLELAKKKTAEENAKLRELRNKSLLNKVARAEYEKIKNLLAKTDIFFKNADTDHPEIQLKTKNKIIEDEVNARRQKIFEIMTLWAYNNDNSIETDQKLIDEIKTYLLIIGAYLEQLKDIVGDLSSGDSGLTAEEIRSYETLIDNSTKELTQIINTIKETEIIINQEGSAGEESAEIEKQIEIVKEEEENVAELEREISTPVATTTATTTPTNPRATTTATTTDRRPRIVNPDPSIIYQPNPAPYRDNGVDIINSASIPTPSQDW